MRIGAHVSVAGGLARAVGNARAVGCEAFQVFVSNSRGWAPPRLERQADDRFRAEVAAAGLGPLFVHAPYLVNFASAGPTTLERSREVVAATLAKAAAIGAAGVVVHAGQARQRAAGGEDARPRAQIAQAAVRGDRLLGLPRVGGKDEKVLGREPRRRLVVADDVKR